MPQKRHTVEQIVAKLRKADVERGKGKKGARGLQTAGSRFLKSPNRRII